MSFKPQNTGAAGKWLNQRSAEERIAEATRETGRLQRARDWIAEYHTRGHRTAFNWLPTITTTQPEEKTTSEETKAKEVVHRAEEEDRGGRQGQLEEAQAGERRFDRSDGDTPF